MELTNGKFEKYDVKPRINGDKVTDLNGNSKTAENSLDLTGNFVVNGHKNCENNEGSLDENVESVAEFIKNSQSLNGVVNVTKGVRLILKT